MKRDALLKALESVMPGVDKSGSPLKMDFIMIEGGMVRSFNDEVSVSRPAELPEDLICGVKAFELYKILSKMEGDNIRLSLESDGKLMVKNPKTTLKMNLLEPKQQEQFQERLGTLSLDQLEWKPLPEGFSEGLELCHSGTRDDPSLGVMGGVGFREGTIYSTDNHRLSVYQMKTGFESEFVLPFGSIRGFLRQGTDVNEVAVTDSWVHFRNPEQLILSMRRVMGEGFPFERITEIIKENTPDKKTKPLCLPDGLEKSLERVEILAEQDDFGSSVIIRKEGDNLVLKGERDAGEIQDKIKWSENAPDDGTELRISPEFLKRVLKISREFQISPNKNCILFSTPKFQHLMVATIA